MALTAAQEHDAPQAEGLLEGQSAGQVMADRGYDSDALCETIKAKGAESVIPGHKNRKMPVEYDKHRYGSRHVIENFFCRIKDPAASPHATSKLLPSSPRWSCFRASLSGSNAETARTA